MFSPRKFTLAALGALSLGLVACGTATETPAGDSAETTTTALASAEAPEAADTTGTDTSETSTTEVSDAETRNNETTSSEAIDTTADAGPIVVDPAKFQVNGQHIFSYVTQQDETGTCLVTPDGATCTGVAGAAVPDISTPPFADQRPGAVSASMGGIHYTILEGVPPAPASLSPGERLVVDAVSCEVSAARDVTCVSGDTSFTISGVDRSIIA
ncbi:hypothetical protein [Corynebacterium sp. A21]|uniref:hypothetical protein n=1 Tax=Corynebacterium sp. A21 TaxID=3457318 RepID=UPI003FD3B920